MAQRDLPALRDLMEVCCLWNSILEPIRLHVGDAAALGKLDLMFKDGKLGVIRSLNQNRVQFELKSKPNFIHAFENSDVSGSIEKFNHVSNHKKITSILYIPPSKATPMYIGKIKCVYISQYVPTL